ncbi:phage tail protein [Streptomyces sp. NPDC048409]|uniref:phage tail protein n=1 Tax=Streptomyces sp. NPDC048409 TaxID=3154723 RepID=UPI0034450464
MTMTANHAPSVISAARFVVTFDTAAPAYFSELTGITSEVEPTEYIAADSKTGAIMHTKQFGKTKPPTVVLRRGVDGSGTIWAWHQMVRAGAPAARMSGTLKLLDASNKPKATYWMTDAWPSKVEVGNLRAGMSEVVLETVTFTCSSIELRQGGDLPW